MSLKTVCTCGHDIDTHYRDLTTGERCTCLGRGCDCKKYDDALKEKPKKALTFHAPYEGYTKPKRRPHKDTSCKCDACREFDAPYTLIPDDGWSPPWTYQLVGARMVVDPPWQTPPWLLPPAGLLGLTGEVLETQEKGNAKLCRLRLDSSPDPQGYWVPRHWLKHA